MPAHQHLTLYRHDRGSHTTIALTGEIDLDTAPPVHVMIENCLRGGIRTIDIDLTVLDFCDISGLNTFLAAAQRAATAGATLSLHHPRPNLARLLHLTGTGFLLGIQSPAVPPEVSGSPAAADMPARPRSLAS